MTCRRAFSLILLPCNYVFVLSFVIISLRKEGAGRCALCLFVVTCLTTLPLSGGGGVRPLFVALPGKCSMYSYCNR